MREFACDCVLVHNNKILLIKRKIPPNKGSWALPGGRIEENETAEQCLVREVKEETGLTVEPTKLIDIYSDPDRDPRGVIAAAYITRLKSKNKEPKGGDDASEAHWISINDIPNLSFDHNKIVRDAFKILDV